MKTCWSLLFLLVAAQSLAVEPVTTATFVAPPAHGMQILSAELWARPRSGDAVVAMPPVRAAVRQLLAMPDGRLVIRFPGGEEGSLWAEELHSWLVALGIDAGMLDMRPGSARNDQIELYVESQPSN